MAASGGAIASLDNASAKAAIVKALAGAIKDQKFDAIPTLFAALPAWKHLGAVVQKAVLDDAAVKALQSNTTAKQPWMSGGGVAVGSRVYQESYDKDWSSYAVEARGRKVSNYQFRASGEWFAEAYAAYYEPVASPSDKGAKLASRDAKTKQFFDTVVDTARGDKSDKSKSGGGAAGKKAPR